MTGSGGITGSGSPKPRFARDVPRAVQQIVRVAIEALAQPLPGERGRMRRVEGGMAGLQAACGHDAVSTTRRQVTAAEAQRLMRRSGNTNNRQVYVVTTPADLSVLAFRANLSGVAHACAFCGAKVQTVGSHLVDGAAGLCRSCQPAFRRDRVWKQTALNLLHDGKTLPSIAMTLGQPLYPGRDDSPLVGVVANMLAEAPDLVPAAFREAYRAAVGDAVPQLWSVITSRSRQRRHRRQIDGDEEGTTTDV